MSEKPKAIIILGPTASGKSDMAVELARKFNGEIISADSRQVYKGLNIGTGKITKKEMRDIKHHLIDVISPKNKKRFTASDFIKLTNQTAVQIVNKNKIPIICGGTGFYIDAFLGDKQIPEVSPNEKLRKQLENKTPEELFEMLKKLDPERASNIDPKNPRRLLRALEICEALGQVPKLKAESLKLIDKKYDVLKIGIKTEEKELKNRINKRIEKWFKQGLLKEVQNLHNKGLSWKRMAEIGLEYKLVAEYYTTQKMSKSDFDIIQLKKKMSEKTWQYAKRQITWFKRDKNIIWFSRKEVSKIEKEVKKFLTKSDFAKATS